MTPPRSKGKVRIADIIKDENFLDGGNFFFHKILSMVALLVVIAGVFLIMGYVLYGGILSGVFKVGDNPTLPKNSTMKRIMCLPVYSSEGFMIKVYISDKARFMFSLFVWFALILIIAAKDLHIVIPSLGLISIAIMFGFLQYRTNVNPIILTVLALILTFLLIPAGEAFPINQIPVQYLLQPRDYLSSYLLIGGMKKI